MGIAVCRRRGGDVAATIVDFVFVFVFVFVFAFVSVFAFVFVFVFAAPHRRGRGVPPLLAR